MPAGLKHAPGCPLVTVAEVDAMRADLAEVAARYGVTPEPYALTLAAQDFARTVNRAREAAEQEAAE